MVKKDMKAVNLRLHVSLYEKVRYIADLEGRSANGQIVFAVRQYIQNFEQMHGEIPLTKPSKAE